jgi:hypothetical protein
MIGVGSIAYDRKPGLGQSNVWPPEPGSGRGRRHGTSSTQPFDRWFRYPAGFASDYAGLLLDRIGVSEGLVVDCFAGSGVTGTAALSHGLEFFGIEAHPLIAELAQLKVAVACSAPSLRTLAAEVVHEVTEHLATQETDAGSVTAGEVQLVQRSFEPDVLLQLVLLRRAIASRNQRAAAQYAKWALLATLRDVATVKVGWPYQRPGQRRTPPYRSPLDRFSKRAGWIADDLDGAAPRSTANVVCGDARDLSSWAALEPGKAQASVSSPPYLNNFDYADATRLELYFLGEVRSWSQMCSTARVNMLTATTQQSSVPERAAAIARLKEMGSAGQEILMLTESLSARRRDRARGKEYDQVAPAYFVGIMDVLSRLAIALEPGATCVWLIGDSAPYGVYVDTPRLIGELASKVGFEVGTDVMLRHRGNRWRTASGRHAVSLTERLLVFHRS